MARHVIGGVRYRESGIEWTTLARGKKGIEILAARQASFEPAGDAPADPAARAAELGRLGPGAVGALTVGLAPGKLLMRVVDLPTTDPAELADMIQLQVDQASPFPEDRMAVSYEVLRTTESGCRVLIAAALKDHIEGLGGLFRAAGLPVSRMDADIMGWWRLLTMGQAVPPSGRRLILLLEPEGGVWIAVQDGVPLAFKAVGAPGSLSPGEYADELASDLGALIVSLDLDHGVMPVSGLDVWCRGQEPEGLVARLGRELGQDARLHALDSLPPLSEGLARRMVQPPFTPGVPGPGAVLDLVPPEWRAAARSRRFRRRLILVSACALGLWAAAILAFLTGFQLNQRALARQEAAMAGLQTPAGGVRLLQRQVRSFEVYLDRQQSALECLLAFSSALPADVNMTTFQFNKGRSVALRGEARLVDPIYDFKKALDQVPLFKSVEMGNVQPGRRKDLTVQTFQITAQLKDTAP